MPRTSVTSSPTRKSTTSLTDVADGHYDGKPFIFDQFQTMENEALRAKLGVAKNVHGLLVREPNRRDASYPLKEFDIVTRIGTHEIDNEGMVQVEDNLRLSFMSQVPKLVRERDRAGDRHAGGQDDRGGAAGQSPA